MIEILIIMTLGILVGSFIHKKNTLLKINHKLLTLTLYFLLLSLGINIGLNEKIINDIQVLGFQSVIITIGAVFGSLVCAYVTYRLFFKNNADKTKP